MEPTRSVVSNLPSLAGVDYREREMENMLMEVEFHDGDISEEEHAQRCWSADEMRPEGGWVAEPRTEGPGIRRPRSNA